MLKNPFLKTLYEKRWVILAWFLAFFLLNLGLIQIFPPMKDAFSTLTDNLPPELAGWFGQDGQIWSSVRGFVSLQIVGQMGMTMVIFGIIFALSLLPSEEQNRTLLTQLSKPVSRAKLYIHKYFALLSAITIVCVGFLLGTFIGTIFVDTVPFLDLLAPTLVVFLLAASFASLTYALALATGKKILAGVIVGAYAFIGYFLAALGGGADIVNTLAHFSPFAYYNDPNVLMDGLAWKNIIFPLILTVAPVVLAFPIFTKRDLNTH